MSKDSLPSCAAMDAASGNGVVPAVTLDVTSDTTAAVVPATSGSSAVVVPATSGSSADVAPATSGSSADVVPATSGSSATTHVDVSAASGSGVVPAVTLDVTSAAASGSGATPTVTPAASGSGATPAASTDSPVLKNVYDLLAKLNRVKSMPESCHEQWVDVFETIAKFADTYRALADWRKDFFPGDNGADKVPIWNALCERLTELFQACANNDLPADMISAARLFTWSTTTSASSAAVQVSADTTTSASSADITRNAAARVVQATCGAMRCIARLQSVKDAFIGYPDLWTIMQTYKDNHKVMDACLSLLFNLCSTVLNKQTVSARPDQGGGLDWIVQAMDLHQDDRNVQGKASALLGRLAAGDQSTARVFNMLEAKVVPRVLRAQSHYALDSTVQADAALAIRNLAMSDRAEKEIVSSGGIRLLFIALHNHPDDMSVLSEATAALFNLACDHESRKEFEADRIFGLRVVVRLLQRWVLVPNMLVKIIRIIRNLASTADRTGPPWLLRRMMVGDPFGFYVPLLPNHQFHELPWFPITPDDKTTLTAQSLDGPADPTVYPNRPGDKPSLRDYPQQMENCLKGQLDSGVLPAVKPNPEGEYDEAGYQINSNLKGPSTKAVFKQEPAIPPMPWRFVTDNITATEAMIKVIDCYINQRIPTLSPDSLNCDKSFPNGLSFYEDQVETTGECITKPRPQCSEAVKERLPVLAALCWTLASVSVLPANKPDMLLMGVLPRAIRIARLGVESSASNNCKRDVLRLLSAIANLFPYQCLIWPTSIPESTFSARPADEPLALEQQAESWCFPGIDNFNSDGPNRVFGIVPSQVREFGKGSPSCVMPFFQRLLDNLPKTFHPLMQYSTGKVHSAKLLWKILWEVLLVRHTPLSTLVPEVAALPMVASSLGAAALTCYVNSLVSFRATSLDDRYFQWGDLPNKDGNAASASDTAWDHSLHPPTLAAGSSGATVNSADTQSVASGGPTGAALAAGGSFAFSAGTTSVRLSGAASLASASAVLPTVASSSTVLPLPVSVAESSAFSFSEGSSSVVLSPHAPVNVQQEGLQCSTCTLINVLGATVCFACQNLLVDDADVASLPGLFPSFSNGSSVAFDPAAPPPLPSLTWSFSDGSSVAFAPAATVASSSATQLQVPASDEFEVLPQPASDEFEVLPQPALVHLRTLMYLCAGETLSEDFFGLPIHRDPNDPFYIPPGADEVQAPAYNALMRLLILCGVRITPKPDTVAPPPPPPVLGHPMLGLFPPRLPMPHPMLGSFPLGLPMLAAADATEDPAIPAAAAAGATEDPADLTPLFTPRVDGPHHKWNMTVRQTTRHHEKQCFESLPESVLNPLQELRFTMGSNASTITPYPLLREIHCHVQQHLRYELAAWMGTVPRFSRLHDDLLHLIAGFLFQEPDESVPKLHKHALPWPEPVADLPPGTTWNGGRFRLSDDRQSVTDNGQPWYSTNSMEFLAVLPSLTLDRLP